VGESVGVAVEGDDVGVVDEAVDDGGGDDLVGEDVAPAAEGPVAGEDGGGGLVAGRDQVEDQVGGAGVEGDVADLVDDQQRDPGQAAQFGLEAVAVVGAGQAHHPVRGGGEGDLVPGLGGADGEGDRQVGLAGAGWAEQDDVGLGGDEVGHPEVDDQFAIQVRGVGEVELLQGLDRGKAGPADPGLGAVCFAGGDLAAQDRGQVFLMAPALLSSGVCETFEAVPDRRRPQRPAEKGQLRGRPDR
jgi:hypothetical protein